MQKYILISKILTAMLLCSFFYLYGQVIVEKLFPKTIQYIGEKIYQSQVAVYVSAKRVAILQMPAVQNISVPVLGAKSHDYTDTWGEARSQGRSHEGTDIFAERGTYVISPTDAIVRRIGVGELGGNFVNTLNPGGERFYFAHLDVVDPQLAEGTFIKKGTIIGTVGNTGNATGTPPHLHFGIYGKGGALNPFGRLGEN